MNYSLPKRAALPLLAMAALLASGCASVAVSNDAIEQNTAQALGLAKVRSPSATAWTMA